MAEQEPVQPEQVFEEILSKLRERHDQQLRELFDPYPTPEIALASISPSYAQILNKKLTALRASGALPEPSSTKTGECDPSSLTPSLGNARPDLPVLAARNAGWWRSVQLRLASCHRCSRQTPSGGVCASEQLTDITLGCYPSWEPTPDGMIPVEKPCQYYESHLVRVRLIASGVPEGLALSSLVRKDGDSELIKKFQEVFDSGGLMMLVGSVLDQHRAVVLLCRHMSKQTKRKRFRVTMMDSEFRSRVQAYWKSKEKDPFHTISNEPCSFVVGVSKSLHDSILRELISTCETRVAHRRPTIVTLVDKSIMEIHGVTTWQL